MLILALVGTIGKLFGQVEVTPIVATCIALAILSAICLFVSLFYKYEFKVNENEINLLVWSLSLQ